MSIQINGTSGISGVDGSATTPALQGTDTNTGLSFGTDEVNIVTGGTTRATVDSSGDFSVNTDSLFVDASADRVGINTSSPQTMLQIGDSSAGNGVPKLRVHRGSGSDYFELDVAAGAPTLQAVGGGDLKFATGSSERMRITGGDANGAEFRFNCTDSPSSTVKGTSIVPNGSNGNYIENATSYSSTYNHFLLFNPNGLVGTISTNGSSTSYNTSSDYRLKENIVPLTGAADRLNQLQVRRFNFIADPDTTVDGFIAHEAQAVVPECVTGTQDEVDDDGNPVYQGIDQSKLVPLLTAALQEALAKIETLETRLTALEGGTN